MSLPRPIAYLCGHYPAVSHTFILREVNALRRLGAEVHTFSIRPAQQHELLSDLDRDAFRTTYSVLPPKPLDLIGAHLRALIASPAGYFATLALALRTSPPGLRGRLWQLFYFAEAMILWRQCAKRGVSHIHAVFANVAADVAMLAASFGRTTRSGDWSWSLAVHGSTEFYDVYTHRLREKVESADLVVCISDFCRSQLMMFSEAGQWDKMSVVHCGVDLGEFAPPAADAATAEEGDAVNLLCVGRMVHLKGYSLVVEAVAELRRRGVDLNATFVGEGPSRAEVEAAAEAAGIAAHVTFAGAVAQDVMHEYYERADIFCMSSFAEGLPVVLIEAMAMGLPVVSTRVAAIPELVEEGVSGLLVPPARADLLADAVETLARDPERRREMGRAGRRKVAAEFDVHRSAEQIHATFSSFLART
jgi:colanic acid/amylovoran biosynthesis glycosyltransferase